MNRQKEWFFELYNNWEDQIHREGMYVFKNKSDAEDLTQTVFMRVIQYMDKMWVLSDGAQRAYMRKIINTSIADIITRMNQLPREYKEIDFDAEAYISKTYLSPEEHIIYRGYLEAIKKMPAIYREVLVLHIICELPLKQIAQICNISEETARKRYGRARKLLAKSNYFKK